MKKITITEKQEKKIRETAINEIYGGWGEKVKAVKDYLDKHFSRANSTIMGQNGRPENKQIVAWLDDYKQVVKTLTDVQLFYIVQDEFKNILSDKDERDKFLKQVIKDWYNHKITKNNSLSVY